MLHRFMFLGVLIQVGIAQAVPFTGTKIVLSGPSPYAIEAGEEIARAGGNVVDVAISMALTLAVTSPYFGSLGGGGLALIKLGDKPVDAIDFREMAPAATNMEYFASNSSRNGGSAVAVPGNPAGYWELHKKYGKLPWKKLFAFPEKLAKNGFKISGEWVEKTERTTKRFNPAGQKFFQNGKNSYRPGEILKQPQLLAALELYKSKGADGFYKSNIARDISKSVQNTGGVLTEQDLSGYRVRWLKPLETDFYGYHIYLMPPPSSGGVILQTALQLTELAKLQQFKYLSVDELHWLAEIDSRSFRERFLLGDPDFYKNPLDQMASKKYLTRLLKSIDSKKTKEISPITPDLLTKESSETTHMSVLDSAGNAVAMTITLNGDYGSGVVSEKFGIALNNEMDDFTTKLNAPNMFGLYQGEGNSVQPGKRPLSSMTPTLAAKDGKVVLSLGAPGGPRIISAVYQVLYRILAQDFDVDHAVQTPRVHHQFQPDVMIVDAQRFSPEILEALRKMGHKVEEKSVAKVYATRRLDDGTLEAAFDARGEGAAGGY